MYLRTCKSFKFANHKRVSQITKRLGPRNANPQCVHAVGPQILIITFYDPSVHTSFLIQLNFLHRAPTSSAQLFLQGRQRERGSAWHPADPSWQPFTRGSHYRGGFCRLALPPPPTRQYCYSGTERKRERWDSFEVRAGQHKSHVAVPVPLQVQVSTEAGNGTPAQSASSPVCDIYQERELERL